MQVALVAFGLVELDVLEALARGITRIFPDTAVTILQTPLQMPADAFHRKKRQYNATDLLEGLQEYAKKHPKFSRIVGVIDADLYASELNFVFGEAYTPGSVGVVSLWRLNPAFYGEDADFSFFVERALKETVHELGHTLGLGHCMRWSCVMRFSNSIFDTDKKQSFFCDQCYLQASIAIAGMDR